jgi:hypothetical protein
VLGEVYEGGGSGRRRSDRAARAGEEEAVWSAGTVPDGVRFVTAAVDVGHRKFDVMIVGWDLEGRSWIIERFTITTRRVKGQDRDIRPAERQDDWLVLEGTGARPGAAAGRRSGHADAGRRHGGRCRRRPRHMEGPRVRPPDGEGRASSGARPGAAWQKVRPIKRRQVAGCAGAAGEGPRDRCRRAGQAGHADPARIRPRRLEAEVAGDRAARRGPRAGPDRSPSPPACLARPSTSSAARC